MIIEFHVPGPKVPRIENMTITECHCAELLHRTIADDSIAGKVNRGTLDCGMIRSPIAVMVNAELMVPLIDASRFLDNTVQCS